MPTRVSKHTVITERHGKKVVVKPNTPFNFTDDEIDHVEKHHGKHAIKKHVVEVDDEPSDAEQKAADAAEAEAAGLQGEGSDEGEPVDQPANKAVVKKAVVPAKKATGSTKGL